MLVLFVIAVLVPSSVRGVEVISVARTVVISAPGTLCTPTMTCTVGTGGNFSVAELGRDEEVILVVTACLASDRILEVPAVTADNDGKKLEGFMTMGIERVGRRNWALIHATTLRKGKNPRVGQRKGHSFIDTVLCF